MILAQIRDMPEWFGQTGGATFIHPVGLAAVLILGVAMLALPRQWAVLPMIAIACLIPSAQRIVVFSLDFTLLRIMVLFGSVRLLVRGEYHGFEWKPIDKLMVAYALSATCIYTFQIGTSDALVNRIGFSFDALGMYFLFRCLIRRWQDIDRLVFGTLLVGIAVAIAFAVEYATRRNLFSAFGGVSAITMIRQGKLRCQGAFSHPILAGCFWAVMIPLFASRWWKRRSDRPWAVVGILLCTFIIYTCNSSTPAFSLLAACVGGLAFYWRHSMRVIRWGIALMILALHVVMRAPVWHLIARVSAVSGSTGYHRYVLVNGFIRNFREWWLFGTRSTAHWGWGAQDITNQYVLEGVRGGLVTLVLFVAVIVVAFQGIGRLWRLTSGNRYHLALSWALGVSLFVHCINFLGVSYFGQIHIAWYLVLAAIGSMSPANAMVYREALRAIRDRRSSELRTDVLAGGISPGVL